MNSWRTTCHFLINGEKEEEISFLFTTQHNPNNISYVGNRTAQALNDKSRMLCIVVARLKFFFCMLQQDVASSIRRDKPKHMTKFRPNIRPQFQKSSDEEDAKGTV